MEKQISQLLVVDREPLMRKYIMSCVLQCGHYEFVEIEEVAQLCRAIRENKPLVIVFDLIQASGHDISRIIESARTISVDYLPFFIAVSPVDDSEKAALAFESGADFYLPKNFSNYHIRGILNSIKRLDSFRSRIRENEGYYLTLFEKAGDAVFIVSLPGMEIYDANSQTAMVYGYQKQELLALNFGNLAEKPAILREKLLNKVTFLMNVMQQRKGGELFPASLAVAYFERNNKPLAIITVKDLIDMERQQEEKEALLDLKRINPDKSAREIFAVLQGEENERRRISRNLHDHIGQQLVSIKLELENQVIHADNNSCRSKILSLRDQMVSTISSLRKLSGNIAGDYLPHSDWIESLTALMEHLRSKKNIAMVLNLPNNLPKLSAFVQGHVYRIIEESITNAIKHSESKQAVINIKPENRKILLVQVVSRGLSDKNDSKLIPGMGIRIMNQRAKLIKSNLLLEVNGQDEFIVNLRVPVNET